MKFRPDCALWKLRAAQEQPAGSLCEERHAHRSKVILRLRWLRTLLIDYANVPFDQRGVFEAQCSVLPYAVQRVVVKGLLGVGHPIGLRHILSISLLTSLDLGDCCSQSIPNSFLAAVADAHPCLQRLYLPTYDPVLQSTLDRFKQLEELDVSFCEAITNVDFCAATLRVLYASHCSNLTSTGLQYATNLEVLHVAGCDKVTSVSSFAHSLLEVNISSSNIGTCGINSAALSQCRLCLMPHGTIDRHYIPCNIQLPCGTGILQQRLGDAALAEATHLVKLDVSNNLPYYRSSIRQYID